MVKNRKIEKAETFWKIRSANYDKLYWTKDQHYIDEIIRLADLNKSQIVLDVGSGTGAVAAAVKNSVRHVVSVDISSAMLEKGNWTGVSAIKWDISELLFANGIFNRVFARMVFHHILDNLDLAIIRCHDLLRSGGKIIVAEGVPPSDDDDVVTWYTDMFKLKEERRTFTPDMLVHYLSKNGFKNVSAHIYQMENFSILNWVRNSGLKKAIQDKILKMHRDAPAKIKNLYQMRFKGNDCLLTARNVIVVGERYQY